VWRRDFDTCQFCGFRSAKYQTVVWLSATQLDINDLATSCVFCEQVLRVDVAFPQKSGVLVWLPQVSQVAINRAMYVLYMLRISQDTRAQRARALLDRLMGRRVGAKERFGSDNPEAAAARLRGDTAPEHRASGDPNEAAALGLRLLPLDRRIVREADLEYNQFPQFLAYLRSKNGPTDMQMPKAWATFDEFERSLLFLEADARA
jgi:intracellular multiplication protein IcmJ